MKQLATLVLLALLTGCVRNELPTKQSNAKSKVDHLIIKEVFYIGHYWVRDVSKWGFKNINNNYNDDQYIEIYNPTDQVQYHRPHEGNHLRPERRFREPILRRECHLVLPWQWTRPARTAQTIDNRGEIRHRP